MQRISSVLPVVSTQLLDSHMRRADFVSFDLIRNRFLIYSALPCSRIFDYLVQLRSRDVSVGYGLELAAFKRVCVTIVL